MVLLECWDDDVMSQDDEMGSVVLLPEWFMRYQTPPGARWCLRDCAPRV